MRPTATSASARCLNGAALSADNDALEFQKSPARRVGSGAFDSSVRANHAVSGNEEIELGARHRHSDATMRARRTDGARHVGVRNEVARFQFGYSRPYGDLKGRALEMERQVEASQSSRCVRAQLRECFPEGGVFGCAIADVCAREIRADEQIAPGADHEWADRGCGGKGLIGHRVASKATVILRRRNEMYFSRLAPAVLIGAVTAGGDVSAANLDAPNYPGATKSDNRNISVSGANGTGSLVAFKTPDSFDQVYRFYKTQLTPSAEKMKVEDGSSSVSSFQMADAKTGEQTTVMVEAKSGETTILITHGSGSGSGSYGTSPSPAGGTTTE